MLSGIRIYTADSVWRQILGDLGATVLSAPSVADVNFDELGIAGALTPIELKSLILKASDNTHIIADVLGEKVVLPRLQSQIIACLYKSGGMTALDLKQALGYAPDVSTHTVDTAIYQLRRTYGHDLIQNNNGVYTIGKL